jgi:uncharacterized protein (TIGR00369 family)
MTNYYPSLDHVRNRVSWVNEAAAGAVCGDLRMEVLGGDESRGEYLFLCHTTPAMRNVIHTLHGGSAAIVVDQAMGSVANSMFLEDGHAPTSQLSLNFHRPMTAGDNLIVRVQIVNASKRLIHLTAEVCRQNAPDKLCVTASSIFFRTGKE